MHKEQIHLTHGHNYYAFFLNIKNTLKLLAISGKFGTHKPNHKNELSFFLFIDIKKRNKRPSSNFKHGIT